MTVDYYISTENFAQLVMRVVGKRLIVVSLLTLTASLFLLFYICQLDDTLIVWGEGNVRLLFDAESVSLRVYQDSSRVGPIAMQRERLSVLVAKHYLSIDSAGLWHRTISVKNWFIVLLLLTPTLWLVKRAVFIIKARRNPRGVA